MISPAASIGSSKNGCRQHGKAKWAAHFSAARDWPDAIIFVRELQSIDDFKARFDENGAEAYLFGDRTRSFGSGDGL